MRDRVLKIYTALVDEYDNIQVKGKKTAYTAMNGNMFSFLDAAGLLCIRLSKEDKPRSMQHTAPVMSPSMGLLCVAMCRCRLRFWMIAVV